MVFLFMTFIIKLNWKGLRFQPNQNFFSHTAQQIFSGHANTIFTILHIFFQHHEHVQKS